MRKKISIVGLLLLVTLLAGCLGGGSGGGGGTTVSTGSLKGEIVDAVTGEKVIADVYLTLDGRDGRTVSDGKYSFANVAVGSRTLVAKVVGYDNYTKVVTIEKDKTNPHVIKLQPKAERTEDVEGLIANLKDAGVMFTETWESNFRGLIEDEITPVMEEIGDDVGLLLEALGATEYDMEIERTEEDSLTIKYIADSGEVVEYQLSGLAEILDGIRPLAVNLEDILITSFSITEGQKTYAEGHLEIRADIDRTLLEEWLEWLDGEIVEMPKELFFTVLDIDAEAKFFTENGEKTFSGKINLEQDANSFELTGMLNTPFLSFTGKVAVSLEEIDGELYPIEVELDGTLTVPDVAELAGKLSIEFVTNNKLEAEFGEILLLPKKAEFTGSYTEREREVSRGQFNFTWENAENVENYNELAVTVEFSGEVRAPGEPPFTLDISVEIDGLEAIAELEYNFGGEILRGTAEITFEEDEYGDLEPVTIFIDLKDEFGNSIEINLETLEAGAEGEIKIAEVRDSAGKLEAEIWVDMDEGLLIVKYESGKTEYLF